NLRVHVAALRRALGDGQAGNRYIATISGRGYRFVAPVTPLTSWEPSAIPDASRERAYNFTVSLTRVVGRADVVKGIVAELPKRPFVTIAGPGGIGKTTVALAVADQLSASYRDGIRFIDLAPLTDSRLVPSTLASVLGVAIRSESPIPGLLAFLREKQMLLVL